MVQSQELHLKNSRNGILDTLLINNSMNRFKKHENAKPSPMSEFYSDSHWASVAISIPKMQESDRFRQELLFTSVFVSCQPELNFEQSETISAVHEKWRKVVDAEQLDGTEPYITFEEFNEWGIRYPAD